MPRFADKRLTLKGSMLLAAALGLFFFSACSGTCGKSEVDRLNDYSYACHYRNLDSVASSARRALALSHGYGAGKAEAYNNLAFERIARMDYDAAYDLLDSVNLSTDNQFELLVADVQLMRLCQRESRNKDFYGHKERAERRMRRIAEELSSLSPRMRRRLLYAETEYGIVCSTYYYYVGLPEQSKAALDAINPSGDIQQDTAQYLNYLYNIGSGGILQGKTRDVVVQEELSYLFKCHLLARRSGMTYWQANSLQSISEHLLSSDSLSAANAAAVAYLNDAGMPDSLVAGYFAQKALGLFSDYGDVYQTAGARRTLALCYWTLGDNASALICLEDALSANKAIYKAPDQVASIRELLSMVYSAVDDKNNSDVNRNEYLDIQEETRQDRQLEARAAQLERISSQLNFLIAAIIALITAVVVVIFVLVRLRKRKSMDYSELLMPLEEWEKANEVKAAGIDEEYENISEQLGVQRQRLEKYKRRAVDNKSKVSLVNSILPYIDRIANELSRLNADGNVDGGKLRRERLEYVRELTECINQYNDVLTHWIQLHKGQLSLHIESFNLDDVFSVLQKSEMSFRLKGISLSVRPAGVTVKADKILTLFMLNTLADNARKFTPSGGRVEISAECADDYVEVCVADTGVGLTENELSEIFDRKVYDGHGFGLMNCKGIIDKYKKTSRIFRECSLTAESRKGRGSRFCFRLPYGVARCMAALAFGLFGLQCASASVADADDLYMVKADAYADSAYYSNINGTYARTLAFADSVYRYLNLRYNEIESQGRAYLSVRGSWEGTPPEIEWLHKGLDIDYGIILDIRNESAVAALALHEWDLYRISNKAYTMLFKELSADRSLEDYCLAMQASRANKAIAVVVLILLLAAVVAAYYFMYYRHVVHFRFCVDEIKGMNNVLLSDASDADKLAFVNGIDTSKYPEVLTGVTVKIREALRHSVEKGLSRSLSLELLKDELRKVELEAEKLYVCNNVIDNCLSTLKHETMYYPSRISRLLDGPGEDVNAAAEVVSYYKDLYLILCRQVARQADGMSFECRPVDMDGIIGAEACVLGDKVLITYMFDVLTKHCGCTTADVVLRGGDDRYAVFAVPCRGGRFVAADGVTDVFTPTTANIPFLVCREIARENGEAANLHGCGITLERGTDGAAVLTVALARAVRAAGREPQRSTGAY